MRYYRIDCILMNDNAPPRRVGFVHMIDCILMNDNAPPRRVGFVHMIDFILMNDNAPPRRVGFVHCKILCGTILHLMNDCSTTKSRICRQKDKKTYLGGICGPLITHPKVIWDDDDLSDEEPQDCDSYGKPITEEGKSTSDKIEGTRHLQPLKVYELKNVPCGTSERIPGIHLSTVRLLRLWVAIRLQEEDLLPQPWTSRAICRRHALQGILLTNKELQTE
ncbi:hypothetical protein CEXT_459331 [Caerostris extrusa]|uniref:Uncharacterized protein n=1 Tax=Caerostris extrusa TaxID=172846 RepID=A0AAV4YF34_CAEEX|nr:hypothetical protein CEXT_459331 [Caerostris extrusa]